MTTDPEDIAGMEMPCQCACGQFFDLNDGHPCGGDCQRVLCEECLPEPFDLCEQCQYLRGPE